MARKYWFARRRAEDTGKPAWACSFLPLSWEGWAMIGVFVAAVALGAAIWTESAAQGLERGWVGFALLTLIGAGLLIAAVGMTCDPDHTVDDYRSGRVRNGDGRD